MGKLAAKNRNGDESWRAGAREARHWLPPGENGRLECTLSPRHCKLREGQIGYCGVRRNIGGVLHTDNYGRTVAAAEEVIETEAIYHYRPGSSDRSSAHRRNLSRQLIRSSIWPKNVASG